MMRCDDVDFEATICIKQNEVLNSDPKKHKHETFGPFTFFLGSEETRNEMKHHGLKQPWI